MHTCRATLHSTTCSQRSWQPSQGMESAPMTIFKSQHSTGLCTWASRACHCANSTLHQPAWFIGCADLAGQSQHNTYMCRFALYCQAKQQPYVNTYPKLLQSSRQHHHNTITSAAYAESRSSRVLLSGAKPMMLRPLSTYITWPVTAEARGEHRKAATLPTSCRR